MGALLDLMLRMPRGTMMLVMHCVPLLLVGMGSLRGGLKIFHQLISPFNS